MSLIDMKCSVDFSSLVNPSEGFNFPSICLMETNLLSTDSLTAFSLIVTCLRPLVVKVLDQSTQALLLLNTDMVLGIISFCRLRSVSVCFKDKIYFTHSSVAYISASAVLLVVIVCLFEDQWSGPWK